MKFLFSIRWRAVYTTNYDAGIQRVYQMLEKPKQNPVIISSTSELRVCDPRFEIPVYHLHGSLFSSSKPALIITESDYIKFRERRKMLFELLKSDFATSNILYIGYSHRDQNWKTILSEIASEFEPNPMPPAYRVVPTTPKLDRELLRSKNIQTIDATLTDFVNAIKLEIPEDSLPKKQWSALSSSIPKAFQTHYEETPASVARLLSSWEYVNEAPFQDTPNAHEFVRGDRPNWALLASDGHFERDIEEPIYDELLDYATTNTKNPRVILITAPAGYGITTLLMALATKLVKERAGAIFMLRPGQQVCEGDVLFAASMFQERNFFFVDNAAEQEGNLREAVGRMKESGKPGLFIIGERINEWRQILPYLRAKEYQIEPLSDKEISGLLGCLKKHGELNALEPLAEDLRFSVIKEKNKQELLVAMREATEGRSFDAILEDEFRGIKDDLSRNFYLAVCCFWQHGAYIRDSLLAGLMGIDVPQMYSKFRETTAGIVVFETINQAVMMQGARARHRLIAAVVWERCGEKAEKEKLIQVALSGLNLNYGSDKDAYEMFVRSDRVVDSISSLEGKMKFFDKAVDKDPSSPYVRQHYARMLSREEKYEAALLQIEEGIKIGPRVRVLYHTKGVVLAKMAKNTENCEFGRRRLAQSEEAFRKTIAMQDEDVYGYQGLASLYIDWAQRAPTEEERTEYLGKAEEIIQAGMRRAKSKDPLWLESARIEEIIGNDAARIKALEKAVKENPSSVVARYLLGRTYRIAGKGAEAMVVLEPIIKNNHEEFRCFMEYCKAMLIVKKPFSDVLAVLNQSTLYGLSDYRFLAFFGGLQFLAEKFSDADKTHDSADKLGLSWNELNRIEFFACDDYAAGRRTKFPARVRHVRAGYSWIEVSGYPDIQCSFKYCNGLRLKAGMKIEVELGFSARGPNALKPVAV